MVKEEWRALAKGLKSAYTSPNFLPDRESLEMWLCALADLDAEVVRSAIVVYIQQNHFPPAIADIREIATNFSDESAEQNEMQAWALVTKAMRNSTYNAETEFEKLPETVQKSVGSPAVLRDWAMCDGDAIQVAQSNFMRTYRVVYNREKQARMLSPNVRNTLGIGTKEVAKIETKKQTFEVERDECFVPAPDELLNNLRRHLGTL